MFTLIRINLNHRNHMIIATSTFPKRSVFKMFCTLRATSLGEASTEGGGGGGPKNSTINPPPPPTILSTFHPSAPPARRELARSVLRPYWTAKSTFSNDLFIFKTVCLKKLHGYAGIHHWSSQKGVYLAWTLYLAWSGVPPPPLQSITYF